MSIPAILIGAALLLVSIATVAGPLWRKNRLKPLDEKENLHDPQRSYEQTLLVLRDLDFDHQLGIVAEADYQQFRASLLVEAAEAYEQMAPGEGELEQLIETAVRERRRTVSHGQDRCASCGAELDPADKYCAACGSHIRSACPQCNRFVGQGDNFCASCGVQLAGAAGAVV